MQGFLASVACNLPAGRPWALVTARSAPSGSPTVYATTLLRPCPLVTSRSAAPCKALQLSPQVTPRSAANMSPRSLRVTWPSCPLQNPERLDNAAIMRKDRLLLIQKLAETSIPTKFGSFQLHLFRDDANRDHLAFVLGDVVGKDNVLTRVHSECFTGEVLGSLRCDCANQLEIALDSIARAGSGALVYLRQEGRGIGLLDKLRAYNLQDLGHDTVDANLLLGHAADERTYHVAAQILRDLQIQSIELLTNNPSKVNGLRDLGIKIRSRTGLLAARYPENNHYLETKARRMGHYIELEGLATREGETRHNGAKPTTQGLVDDVTRRSQRFKEIHGRPFVTLSYAQSLDGCLSARSGETLALSGPEALGAHPPAARRPRCHPRGHWHGSQRRPPTDGPESSGPQPATRRS